MILSARIGELRLQKELVPTDPARGDRCADPLFDVVLALIGGINPAKTSAEREAGQLRRALLLPRRAVEKQRNLPLRKRRAVAHADSIDLCPLKKRGGEHVRIT